MSQDPRCVTGGVRRKHGSVSGYALRDRWMALGDGCRTLFIATSYDGLTTASETGSCRGAGRQRIRHGRVGLTAMFLLRRATESVGSPDGR